MNKTKLDVRKIGKIPTNPLFDDLPEALKDSACYVDIERRLNQAVFSDHPHKTMKGYARCKRCTAGRERQAAIKKEVGFTSQDQYLEWKRIMSIIISQSDIHLS